MERDMDLVRSILLAVEEQCGGSERIQITSIEGHSSEAVLYHLRLLYEAGYLHCGKAISRFQGTTYLIRGLSWEGHDFLDTVRSESVWRRVREKLAEQGGSTAIEPVKRLALEIAKSELLSVDPATDRETLEGLRLNSDSRHHAIRESWRFPTGVRVRWAELIDGARLSDLSIAHTDSNLLP